MQKTQRHLEDVCERRSGLLGERGVGRSPRGEHGLGQLEVPVAEVSPEEVYFITKRVSIGC